MPPNTRSHGPDIPRCPVCHFSVEDNEHVERHMKLYHPMERANSNPRCPVCHFSVADKEDVERHMKLYHPTERANSNPGRQLTYYPCDMPGCGKLANNVNHGTYVTHLSRVHGIDQPSMMRTTESWYLESKNKDILQMHVMTEATELNAINSMIRDLERCFAADPPPGGYRSCHGFDVQTHFGTSLDFIPGRKSELVAYLQLIRNMRNEVGSLYNEAGVDTRDGVLDDLETLLDVPHYGDDDYLEVPLKAAD